MFRTQINITPSAQKINHASHILSLGSCFAANVGEKLQNLYFDIDINPFGVQYNPLSIAKNLSQLIENRIFTEHDLFQYRSLWHSFAHDSSFSAISKEECLNLINQRFTAATKKLQSLDFLFLTFGTSWVFEQNNDTHKTVSNCHKLPTEHFTRRRLSVEETVKTYEKLFEKLFKINPNMQVLFSVSPIRHLKDGLHENNLSKSTLLLAIENLVKNCKNATYFPAYELLLDDLRDYRFFAADMLHPSSVAIDYIWQHFGECYFTLETTQLNAQLSQYNSDLHHRPLHPQSADYQIFIKKRKKRKKEIVEEFPFLQERIFSI